MTKVDTIFCNYSTDIPTGLLKHFCNSTLSEEQYNTNLQTLLSYYLSTNQITKWLKYVIRKELEETKRSSDQFMKRDSVYSKCIKTIIQKEGELFLQKAKEIVLSSITENKTKLVIGKLSHPGVQKSLDKMKNIISRITDLIISSSFSSFIGLFINLTLSELKKKFQEKDIIIMRRYLLVSFISSYLMDDESVKTHTMNGDSLRSVIVVFQWFSDPQGFNLKKKLSDSMTGTSIEYDEKDEDDWRNYLKTFCAEKREMIDTKLNSFRNDEEFKINEIQIEWVDMKLKETIEKRLDNEWKEIQKLVSSESALVLQLQFANESEVQQLYQKLFNDLQNLSENTQKEKIDLAQKMASMKTEIKDLEEEIKFLKELLGSK